MHKGNIPIFNKNNLIIERPAGSSNDLHGAKPDPDTKRREASSGGSQVQRPAGQPAGAGLRFQAEHQAQFVNKHNSVLQIGNHRAVDIFQTVGGRVHQQVVEKNVFAHQDRHGNKKVIQQVVAAEQVVRPAALAGNRNRPGSAGVLALEARGANLAEKIAARELREELRRNCKNKNKDLPSILYGDRQWNLCHVIATSSTTDHSRTPYFDILRSSTVLPKLAELLQATDSRRKTPREVAKEFGNEAEFNKLLERLELPMPSNTNTGTVTAGSTLTPTVVAKTVVNTVRSPDAGDTKAVDVNIAGTRASSTPTPTVVANPVPAKTGTNAVSRTDAGDAKNEAGGISRKDVDELAAQRNTMRQNWKAHPDESTNRAYGAGWNVCHLIAPSADLANFSNPSAQTDYLILLAFSDDLSTLLRAQDANGRTPGDIARLCDNQTRFDDMIAHVRKQHQNIHKALATPKDTVYFSDSTTSTAAALSRSPDEEPSSSRVAEVEDTLGRYVDPIRLTRRRSSDENDPFTQQRALDWDNSRANAVTSIAVEPSRTRVYHGN